MAKAKRRKARGEPALMAELMTTYSGPTEKSSPREFAPPMDDLTWRRIVGVGVAQRSRPLALRRGILWVHVVSSAWAQELSLLQTTLLERLAIHGWRAQQIRFRVGPMASTLRPVKIDPPPMPRAPLPAELEVALRAVVDEQLRTVLAETAGMNLAWQQGMVLTRTRATPDLRSMTAQKDFSAVTARRALSHKGLRNTKLRPCSGDESR